MPETLAQRLAKTVCAVYRQDEPFLRDKAKLCLLDYFAAVCAGAAAPSGLVAQRLAQCFGEGPCTCVGQARTATGAGAALCNGLAGHAEELDDSHRYASGMHLGVTIIPALFALAEEENASADALFRAMAAGYETAGRVCRCLDRGHRQRGFHATGTIGVFGAAAACSLLLDPSGRQLVNALGVAASSSGGLFAFLDDGSTVKHYHAGRASMDGYLAARLAQSGLTGPSAIFEAREGFFNAYAATSDPRFMDEPLNQPELLNIYHKLHSACGHAFPAIDTALELRTRLQEQALDLDAVATLEYDTYHAGAILINPEPETAAQARFSVPFMLATALVFGEAGRQTLMNALCHPQVMALSRRVVVRENPAFTEVFPAWRKGELRVHLHQGAEWTFAVDAPRGTPENPVTPEGIVSKFHQEAAPLFGANTRATLVGMITNLEAFSPRKLGQELRAQRVR